MCGSESVSVWERECECVGVRVCGSWSESVWECEIVGVRESESVWELK